MSFRDSPVAVSEFARIGLWRFNSLLSDPAGSPDAVKQWLSEVSTPALITRGMDLFSVVVGFWRKPWSSPGICQTVARYLRAFEDLIRPGISDFAMVIQSFS
jgi:hypothetical protein